MHQNAPSPDPPLLGGDTPSPDPTPLGAFGVRRSRSFSFTTRTLGGSRNARTEGGNGGAIIVADD